MRKQYRYPAPPKAGDTLPLVTTRTVQVKDETPAANQPKHGKLDYLAGPPKKKGKGTKPAPTGTRLVEKRQLSIGRYVGTDERLTAFVMLDPDEVSQVQAAND